ncbi:MAG TPA: methylenetetrahydrofolate reductase, partial [Planctomycetota bacterium]|nr:methylenetetrahydrofolate reductase [Planctomycetota bacterium]
PPKGTNVALMFEEAEHLRGKVVAINVTDIQSSVMRLSSIAVCIKLKQMGLEPILQMVCRDRNRLALQSDLLGAAMWGIENVLCLTGDHVSLGDHKAAKGVFDLDSVTLLKAAATLASGKDMAGNDLDGSPSFFTGAVVAPASDPVEPQILKMKKKVDAGAKFFQTQAVYDPKQMEEFMKKVASMNVPVLAGIVLLKSPQMATFMNQNVAGVHVPDELIQEIGSVDKKERKKKSVEIAARLVKQMKDCCNGVHIMPLGWDSLVPDVLDKAGV